MKCANTQPTLNCTLMGLTPTQYNDVEMGWMGACSVLLVLRIYCKVGDGFEALGFLKRNQEVLFALLVRDAELGKVVG